MDKISSINGSSKEYRALMYPSVVMYTIPLWLLFIIGAAIVMLAIETGWRIGNFMRKRTHEEKEMSISAAVGATLGLLAFLLAFTFDMAATRYNHLKEVVVQEADAIDTTYLRADYLPKQPRDEVRSLLREYAALRSGGKNVVLTPEGLAETASIQDQLWAIAADAGSKSGSFTTALFIQSLNDMKDADTERISTWRNGIPDPVWLMLGVVTIFSMTALGYEFGTAGYRGWVVTILLAIAFTTVLMLTADLDQSQAGLVQVSQQPLLDVLKSMATPIP
jgi:hypothetical protein